MKAFMDENFMLDNEVSEQLFHQHAKNLPIIDYHCHLNPEYIARDHKFDNLGQIWLEGDHYKWRAMRTNGIDERYCTGKDTSDWEKFDKWAEALPYTMRNPLYHWTHLELRTAFGVDKILKPETAREIFDECTAKLRTPEFSARGLMRKYSNSFRAYVEKLAQVAGLSISRYSDLIAALRVRHDFFASVGCKLSDHGIEEFYAEDYTQAQIDSIFNKVYG